MFGYRKLLFKLNNSIEQDFVSINKTDFNVVFDNLIKSENCLILTLKQASKFY